MSLTSDFLLLPPFGTSVLKPHLEDRQQYVNVFKERKEIAAHYVSVTWTGTYTEVVRHPLTYPVPARVMKREFLSYKTMSRYFMLLCFRTRLPLLRL